MIREAGRKILDGIRNKKKQIKRLGGGINKFRRVLRKKRLTNKKWDTEDRRQQTGVQGDAAHGGGAKGQTKGVCGLV